MTIDDLKFAVEDCERFISRAKSVIEKTTGESVETCTAKNLARFSLDAERALKAIRSETSPTR